MAHVGLAEDTRSKKVAREGHWQSFCELFDIDPLLDTNFKEREDALMTFAIFVGEGNCASKGNKKRETLNRVRADTVANYLLSAAEYCQRSSGKDPRHYEGSKVVLKGLSDLMKGWAKRDAPSDHGRAYPFHCLEKLASELPKKGDGKKRRIALLILLGFSFMLRRSEYVDCGRKKEEDYALRMKIFSMIDCNGKYLLRRGVFEEGITAGNLDTTHRIEIAFTEQKNLTKDETVSEFRRGNIVCPVRISVLIFKDLISQRATREDRIRSTRGNRDVTSDDITTALRELLVDDGMSPMESKQFATHS
jgi:hypothetical protein